MPKKLARGYLNYACRRGESIETWENAALQKKGVDGVLISCRSRCMPGTVACDLINRIKQDRDYPCSPDI